MEYNVSQFGAKVCSKVSWDVLMMEISENYLTLWSYESTFRRNIARETKLDSK